jgi:hypothetical protein
MTIFLYVLVDKTGRILYTDSTSQGCEEFKKALGNVDYKIIKLKGVLK